jgi:tetratricopeptide (TPR) repeat protein
MKRYTLLLMVFLALTGTAFAQDDAEAWFEQANTAYNSGNYDSAIVVYEKILDAGMESVPVYYNMGNAYYKLREFPMAIYCYEKALKIDPSDEEVQANLAIANAAIVDKLEPMPQSFIVRWWHNLRSLLPGDAWAWCSIAAFALLLLMLFLFLRARKVGLRKLGFFMGVIFLIVFALSVIFAVQLKHIADTKDHAIIMTPTVTVKSSPSVNSVDLFVLHEGTKISVMDTQGDWAQIRIADGSVGWLEVSEMRIF